MQPKFIEPELRRFTRDLYHKLHSDDQELLDIVSWANMRIGEIHPWTDGNGRAARALVNILLIQHKIFPMPVFDTMKLGEYKDAVELSALENPERLKEFFLAELVNFKQRLRSRAAEKTSYSGPVASAGFFDPARMFQKSSGKSNEKQDVHRKGI